MFDAPYANRTTLGACPSKTIGCFWTRRLPLAHPTLALPTLATAHEPPPSVLFGALQRAYVMRVPPRGHSLIFYDLIWLRLQQDEGLGIVLIPSRAFADFLLFDDSGPNDPVGVFWAKGLNTLAGIR